MKRACYLLAATLALAACRGAPPPRPARAPEPPRASPPAAPATPRAGTTFPACDPRWRDPDRTRMALGLLAADCADDKGRNAVYVTRLVGVLGTPSPAQRAGVKAGDRIVRVDSCEVPSTDALARQLRHAPPGWVARLFLERGGKVVDVFVPTVPFAEKTDAKPAPGLLTAGCKAIGRAPAR